MKANISLSKIYKPSEGVVARDVHDEFVIIPITSGIGDLEDEIYSLNETGRDIWKKLDGKKDLKGIARALSEEFQAPLDEIENDCLGLTSELLKRKLVIETKR